MKLSYCALLCVTGLAACSHTASETARDPSYDNQQASASVEPTSTQPASTEPGLRPASLESAATPAPAPKTAAAVPNTTTPAPKTPDAKPVDGAADARTPVMANDKANPGPSDVSADNTKKNERDRSSAALTPMDQNNNQSDLKITQQIRQAVMGDSSLSFTAKNVKIITQNGHVTLRGPVNSEKERSAIEAAARRVAGAVEIDNQIEVKK